MESNCFHSILVIDDDAFNRILLKTNLEEQGYLVEIAEHGKLGMEMLVGKSFDLVLTDLMMPEMNGYEVLQWMKTKNEYQTIPVIVISGEEDMESIIKCIQVGATDYLPKPFDPILLRARVRNAINATKHLRDKENNLSGQMLVVDDDLFNRTLLATNLVEQGYSVTMAENGRNALDILHENIFDVVLLDLLMPEMDGFQTLSVMKADSRLNHIPVIIISGEEDLANVVQCIEMGAEDYLPKPFDPVFLKARVRACLEKKRLRDHEIKQQQELSRLNSALEVRNSFIRETFGRYLSDEIVNTILESPKGMALGGEKRLVTILMSDLRGFTPLSERLQPDQLVNLLNLYFDVMTDIIFRYQGTIDEFIGDAILAIFGAPITRENDAKRAVACALEMQLAMAQVNQRINELGFPKIAMGIGINTGEIVVGNIGSAKRMKYSVIGRHVNLTSRIESYTVGGQVLTSQSTLDACDNLLRVDSQMEVLPKGVKEPITIYEIGGISGNFNISLPEKQPTSFTELAHPLQISMASLESKHTSALEISGQIVSLSENAAEIVANIDWPELTNLKLSLYDSQENIVTRELFAKTKKHSDGTKHRIRIEFTSVPPEATAFLNNLQSLPNPECADPWS